MRYGRRFSLPIDPWPRASLGERLSVGVVLTLLLLVPFCAVGAACVVAAALSLHVYRSYDVGAALRAAIDRHVGRGVGAPAAEGRVTERRDGVRRA